MQMLHRPELVGLPWVLDLFYISASNCSYEEWTKEDSSGFVTK